MCSTIFFTAIAIFFTAYSNTSKGRIFYKNLFDKELTAGIDGLFQPPNYYISPDGKKPVILGGWNFFTLKKGVEGFERIKNFIATCHYKNLGGKNVKFLIQYQTLGIGNDHQNPTFRECVIFFIPDTKEYEDITVNSLDVEEKDKLLKLVSRFEWITTQSVLTQDLNTYFTNKIVRAVWLYLWLPIIALEFLITCLGNGKKK